jgi:hypothetical protein
MKNVKKKVKNVKELEFESKAVKVTALEERKEMIVLWRRGEGMFPGE